MMLDGYPVFESMQERSCTGARRTVCEIGLSKYRQSFGEYTYEVAMELTEDTIWADAGHETVLDNLSRRLRKRRTNDKKMQVIYGDVNIGVKGEGFLAMFSKSEGGLASLRYDGTEYITRAPKTSYWRACTDNDRGAKQGFDRSMYG